MAWANVFCPSEPKPHATRRSFVFSRLDPVTFLEASLTSLKYAFYQAVGHASLRRLHCRHATHTTLAAATVGLVGGGIFTLPYLILLLKTSSRRHAIPDSWKTQLRLLSAEALYSGIAGGVGAVAMEGFWMDLAWTGIACGAVGPIITFGILFSLLRVAMGILWVTLKLRTTLFEFQQ